jgi:hypothetical protein
VNETDDECKGSGFGRSYVTKDKCGVHCSDHSVRYGTIIKDQGNESYPYCEKVRKLLSTDYDVIKLFEVYNVRTFKV